MSTVLGSFDLDAEIAKFQPGEGTSGRRAETLIKNDRLRVVLVTMRTGSSLQEHTAPGPITIQPLRGSILVTYEGGERQMTPGDLLALEAGVKHAVTAETDGAFLLTIGWGKASAT